MWWRRRREVSIPILNEATWPQISPSNTGLGLTTQARPSAGEPDKYYPTGERTYARIVPKDTIQGAALATLMKEDGCTKVHILNDKEVYGTGLADESRSRGQGAWASRSPANEGIDKKAPNYRSLASKVKGPAPTASSSRRHHRQQRRAACTRT